ncbi:hypothetical protein ACKLNR_000968 [Fusarium oxysporum f. sp. zingiberi]
MTPIICVSSNDTLITGHTPYNFEALTMAIGKKVFIQASSLIISNNSKAWLISYFFAADLNASCFTCR